MSEDARKIEEEINRLRIRRDEIGAEIGRLTEQLADLKAKDVAIPESPTAAIFPLRNPEQLSFEDSPDVFGEAPEKLLSKSSSIEEKYELFVSLFAGRPDVHARRWASAKTGRLGYSPACRNDFVRPFCAKGRGDKSTNCIECEHRAFYPITLHDFEKHIGGEKDDCSDVLGAYPMDSDEMCTFIVMDFDDENRKQGKDAAVQDGLDSFEMLSNAAIAFRRTCLANGVPAYLEISRSGEGMHVWIFFADKVEAKKARKLCSSILTLAMNKYPDIHFNSYDRLIPNQDTLPKNGIGNLIALPLQGRAGRRHHSLFIDEDLSHYPDQWEYLSSVLRMTAAAMDAVLSEIAPGSDLGELIANDEDGEVAKPWEKRKPEINLSAGDATGEIEIVRANMIHIAKKDLSARAINKIRRLAAFRNPEFYKTQAMRRSTWNIPRIISTSEETKEYVSIPRGAEAALLRLLEEASIGYSIDDKTTPGKRIDVQFAGELREEQEAAAGAILAYENGILHAATAFGKTVIGVYLISEIKVNTLILVDNMQLLNQWKEALDTFLCINEEPPERFTPTGRKKRTSTIGVYSGAKKDLSGIVDIATIQSLYAKGEVKDFVKEYGLVIVDECHHISAPTFEPVMKQVGAKYVYGLTATPEREDGHHTITYLQCGPVRYRVDAKAQAEKRPFDHFVIPKFTRFIETSVYDETNYAELLNQLCLDESRNKLIVDDVLAAIKERRNPIILTERVEHVKILTQALSANVEKVIPMAGGMGAVKRRETNRLIAELGEDDSFVIVATGKYAGEGFDCPRLDTLFLAMPIAWKGRVAQYTGRLHRLYQGKSDVIVYDYVDANIPVLERMYYKRIRGYKSVGYKTLAAVQGKESYNIIFSPNEYWDPMMVDMESAKKEIVISSPFISGPKITAAMPILSMKLIDNVAITVTTKPPEENAGKYREAVKASVDRLSNAGVKVACESDLHQRFVVIDQRIVWYGSINPLGFSGREENAMRFEDAGIAKALLNQKYGKRLPEEIDADTIPVPKQISLFNSID